MTLRSDIGLPCATFFAAGKVKSGVLALAMQVSIVFWPLAIKWARGTADQTNVERMLAELAETYQVPADPYARPKKRFRQIA